MQLPGTDAEVRDGQPLNVDLGQVSSKANDFGFLNFGSLASKAEKNLNSNFTFRRLFGDSKNKIFTLSKARGRMYKCIHSCIMP